MPTSPAPDRHSRPAPKLPVLALIQPITYGPKKPDRLPSELIAAIPPAAAAPDRNAAGKVQITGRQPKMPKPAIDSATIFSVGSSSPAAAPIPPAATSSAIATCRLRSSLRSEWRPHRIMLITPTTYGSDVTKPVCRLVSPNDLTICGRKKLKP